MLDGLCQCAQLQLARGKAAGKDRNFYHSPQAEGPRCRGQFEGEMEPYSKARLLLMTRKSFSSGGATTGYFPGCYFPSLAVVVCDNLNLFLHIYAVHGENKLVKKCENFPLVNSRPSPKNFSRRYYCRT